jgi:hypothetical protein
VEHLWNILGVCMPTTTNYPMEEKLLQNKGGRGPLVPSPKSALGYLQAQYVAIVTFLNSYVIIDHEVYNETYITQWTLYGKRKYNRNTIYRILTSLATESSSSLVLILLM